MTELKEILQLSVEKRIHLVQTIWDSIAEEALNADLSEEHKAILKERYESYQSNPDDNVSWEEVKKKIQDKL
ncbi:MAG TPA: addiction module protein [Bacteroidales bacterium]|nr:addiction module protein [Bacteroidales bacterium]HRX95380.1 addiction module protein [Bacteroidales bacterium]